MCTFDLEAGDQRKWAVKMRNLREAAGGGPAGDSSW